jgi:hypothetical protein
MSKKSKKPLLSEEQSKFFAEICRLDRERQTKSIEESPEQIKVVVQNFLIKTAKTKQHDYVKKSGAILKRSLLKILLSAASKLEDELKDLWKYYDQFRLAAYEIRWQPIQHGIFYDVFKSVIKAKIDLMHIIEVMQQGDNQHLSVLLSLMHTLGEKITEIKLKKSSVAIQGGQDSHKGRTSGGFGSRKQDQVDTVWLHSRALELDPTCKRPALYKQLVKELTAKNDNKHLIGEGTIAKMLSGVIPRRK